MPIAEPEAPLKHAPGAPGISPTWTSSAKDMVGCSLGPARLWFTLGFGIVNEVYYPRVDIPQIRDLGFIVAGPDGFWSEVKRNENYTLRLLAPGVPAVEIVHEHPRYTLRLRITPDPRRDVLVDRVPARPGRGGRRRISAFTCSLAPHLGATGYDNVATRRTLPLAPRADGRAGAVRHGARRGRSASARRVRPRQRRLCRHAATAGRISRATAR